MLGVTGGIAAYRACELARLLVKSGKEVRVVMTEAATKFVAPLTFATLTGAPVAVDGFGPSAWKMEHIELGRWAELFVIAPATADVLAKLAGGEAEELLSTTHLAFEGELLLAPAMNTAMWRHPAVVENCRRLSERGARFVGPREGELACGETGVGPMADPGDIVEEIESMLTAASGFEGRRVLVTAGPTVEYIDPVRYLSNPSTGLMGIELAREAARRGAEVCLVHGPLAGSGLPGGIPAEPVVSAQQMYEAVMRRIPQADVFIGAAAVSDFRPVRPSAEKLKKEGKRGLTLELERSPDILQAVGRARRPGQVVVGFALETGELLTEARKKLASKRADLIVANAVGAEGAPFGSSSHSILLVPARGEPARLPPQNKRRVAGAVLDRVKTLLDG